MASSSNPSYCVAVLVGSLRKASLNRKAAVAMQGLAHPSLAFEFIEIGDLPNDNEDLDAEGRVPPAWQRFRDAVRRSTACCSSRPSTTAACPAC